MHPLKPRLALLTVTFFFVFESLCGLLQAVGVLEHCIAQVRLQPAVAVGSLLVFLFAFVGLNGLPQLVLKRRDLPAYVSVEFLLALLAALLLIGHGCQYFEGHLGTWRVHQRGCAALSFLLELANLVVDLL